MQAGGHLNLSGLNEDEYFYLHELGESVRRPVSSTHLTPPFLFLGFTDVPFNALPSSLSLPVAKPSLDLDDSSHGVGRDRAESFDSTADYFSSNSSFSMPPPPGLRLTRSHSGCTDDSESLEEHFLHERRERSLSRLSVSSTASMTAEHDLAAAMGMPPLGLYDPLDHRQTGILHYSTTPTSTECGRHGLLEHDCAHSGCSRTLEPVELPVQQQSALLPRRRLRTPLPQSSSSSLLSPGDGDGLSLNDEVPGTRSSRW